MVKRRGTNGHLPHESGATWSASSVRGSQRAQNSDFIGVFTEGRCHAFVVADGVGALEASGRASVAAVEAAIRWTAAQEHVAEDDAPSLVRAVDDAVKAAVSHDRGATTLAYVGTERDKGLLVTVGDSEVLAVGEEGEARRLNPLDHVPAQPNMLLAWIDGEVDVEPHVIALDALPYRLVLATDGVTGVLDTGAIADIVRRWPIDVAASRLVHAARDKGAQDDASAIVIAAQCAPGGAP